MSEQPTAAEMLMAEMAATLAALVEYEMEKLAQPPRGTIEETGHYRTLNGAKLKRKEWEALQQLLETLAYNVASSFFATLDGSVESHFEGFPALAVVERGQSEPIAPSLQELFSAMWEEEDEAHPHPD